MKKLSKYPNKFDLIRGVNFLICLFFILSLSSQEVPPIQNYIPGQYNAENQNWAISQSGSKIIYIANNKGLLVYNGANWELYDSPNETILRSVEVSGEKIYTGYFMEFGYWQRDELGLLIYNSLSAKLGISHIEDEEFWNIWTLQEDVVFQSLDRIYIYNLASESLKILDTKGKIIRSFEVAGSIYFQREEGGLYKVNRGEVNLFSDHRLFEENEIINLFEDSEGLLILTQDNGFFRLKDGKMTKWAIEADSKISSLRIYSAIKLKNGNYAIGTISKGMLYVNGLGKLIYDIDQSKGLQNNTVLSIFEDANQNIWLGLDHGISFVNIDAPFKVFRNNFSGLGSVYATAIFEEFLYLGTNQGLFYKRLSSKEDFRIINNTQGQVWSLKVINGKLFCGHHNGIYVIKGSQAQVIASPQGIWDIKPIDGHANLLLLGGYGGLYILQGNKGKWSLKNKIAGFDNSARYFEIEGDEIFVNHEYKGVFHVIIDSTFSKAKSVVVDTFIKGANSGIIKFSGDIFYAYKHGILKYNRILKRFEKDSILSNSYGVSEYVSGRIVSSDIDSEMWVFTKSKLINISPGQVSDRPIIKSYPLTNQVRSNVVEYENIIKYDDKNFLLGTESGYILLNVEDFVIDEFEIHLNFAEISEKKVEESATKRINKDHMANLISTENNIKFSFYSPEFHKYLETDYQYRLIGSFSSWSKWSASSSAVFENLRPGDYIFEVKARIGDKISQNTASFSFTIEKPWYLSFTMLALYGLSILLFLGFVHTFYNRHYRKQKQKLIESNRRQLEFAKVQNEKELIKVKNEQLQDDINSKSKELAASTMSIVRKNELLNNIKMQLQNVKDKQNINPVIKLIDKNVNHNDTWNLFKEAFDNADREFLVKLNELHPNLTPNDIKLCAYLRLNFSSKEIAPLFNISARSVEIKRYRLRKKMGLSHEKNLASYILDI